MRLRFRPVDSTFFDLFAESARHLLTGSRLLAEMLDDGADRAVVAKQMREAEHEADEATHAIIRRANSTFVTPIDREDIYALAAALDDVMDLMDEAVDLLLLYELTDLPPGVSEQVEVLQLCAELTAGAMPRLRSLKRLDDYWIEINRLENAGDRSYRRTLAHLFDGSYKAIAILKIKDVVTSLEGAIDAFETVANVVEQISVKES